MSLSNCPECGEKVSENAVSCPHCGNPLTSKCDSSKATHISYSNTHKIGGLFCIFIGTICTLFSLYVLPIGIISAIGGIGIVLYGSNLCAVHKIADCPYCGKEIAFSKNSTGTTCIHCKKRSVIENETLKTVN